ncbi:Hypothetical predicted protein [Octopus vulgaris]|uniref:Uncharacterized protein n=1 Tax=Octopus vulgaris TaxID=6645 RepID=A0AA36B7J8_OCTVU|nr:Hypothetical predicted protein [Octopus vulgaris]
MKWVPNRKATATGFVLCTHALSATIFTYVSSIYINPDNYQENEVINGEAYFNQKDLLARVPKCFLMLGFVFLVSQLISICMISNPKEETTTIVIQNDAANVDDTEGSGEKNKSFQDNDVAIQLQNEANDIQTQNIQDENKKEMMDKSPIGTAPEKESEPEEDYFTPFQMVKTKQFYSLWLLTFILSMQYTTIVAVYKIYGMTFISDDNFLTILGSVCAVGNAVAKMSWGLICDKLLFKVISGLLNPFILKGMQNFFGWNWTFFFFEAISFIGLILTVMFQKPRKPERRGSTLSVTEHKSEP